MKMLLGNGKVSSFTLIKIVIMLAISVGVQTTPAQITNLGIAIAGGQSVLYWPTSSTNYVLQTTTNLNTPNWTDVSNAVPVVAVAVTNNAAMAFFRLVQITNPPSTTADGMALIPAGTFTMGDTLDGESDALPISATISAFYMDTNLVSYGLWTNVYAYATANGYDFDNVGSGKNNMMNQPVQTVDWYDCVKWCNARSEMEGLTPVYFTDATLTTVYRTGNIDISSACVSWAANGYRLPTEAEWEKAARGGLNGLRFPWGNFISEGQANYYGNTNNYSYDFGPNGYNAIGSVGGTIPPTSPVGSFAANNYGLNDMAGNVFEWCWDWYAGTPYPSGSPYLGGTDPRGPASGDSRVQRGGCGGYDPNLARCAFRLYSFPVNPNFQTGFRCVRGF